MYIKDFDYENIAFTIIKIYIEGVKRIKESGNIPAKFDIEQAIHNGLPEKYLDKNTTNDSYWTKHNEKKLRKYIKTEITRRIVLGKL